MRLSLPLHFPFEEQTRSDSVAASVSFVVVLIGSLMLLWFGVRSGLLPIEFLRQALASRAQDALTTIPDVA